MTGRDLNFLCLPGDGIGPEIMCATKTVLDALSGVGGLHINWSDMEIGFSALKSNGSTIPNAVIEAARAADGVILGPVSHNAYPPVAEGGLNPSGVLRRELDLFANIRPAVSPDAVPSPILKSIDLVIYRENLEVFYADRNMASGGSEFMAIEGVALAMRKITASGSARIAREAFEGAMQRPAKHVTAVHKVNVMRLTDGLFLDEVRKLAAQYPEITYDEVLVDSAAALLVRDPGRFDVIVTTNMFGDILSDLASEISGGLGLAGSLNRGAKHAVAQAQHGSAPDIAGQNCANPTSLIRSAAMLLLHIGANRAAALLTACLNFALSEPKNRTEDLGGPLGTQDFALHLASQIRKKNP